MRRFRHGRVVVDDDDDAATSVLQKWRKSPFPASATLPTRLWIPSFCTILQFGRDAQR